MSQGFSDEPPAEQTSQRFLQVFHFLRQLSQPLYTHKLLPCTQNFCAWLPSEVVKENYLRISSALAKVQEAITRLSYLLRNGVLADQNTRMEFADWRDRVRSYEQLTL